MTTFGTTKKDLLDRTKPVSVSLTRRQCDYLMLYQEAHPKETISAIIRTALDEFIERNPPATLIPAIDQED